MYAELGRVEIDVHLEEGELAAVLVTVDVPECLSVRWVPVDEQLDPPIQRGHHHGIQTVEYLLLPVRVVVAELGRPAGVCTGDGFLNLAQERADAAVLPNEPVDDVAPVPLNELAHLLHVQQLLAVRGLRDDRGGGNLFYDVLDDPRALVDLVDQCLELIDGIGAPLAVLKNTKGVPVEGMETWLQHGLKLGELNAVKALLNPGEVHGLVVELKHVLDRAPEVDEVVLRKHGLHGNLGNLKVHAAQVVALLDDRVQVRAEVALHLAALLVDTQDGILQVSQRGLVGNFHPVPIELLLVLHHSFRKVGVLARGHRSGGFGSHLPLSVPLELSHRLANLAEEAAAPCDGSRHRGLAAVHLGSLVVFVKHLPHVDNLPGELLKDVRHLALDRSAYRAFALHSLEVLHQVKGSLCVAQFLEARVDELLGAPLDGLLLSLKIAVDVRPVGEGLLIEHVELDVHNELGHVTHAVEHRVDTLGVASHRLELRT